MKIILDHSKKFGHLNFHTLKNKNPRLPRKMKTEKAIITLKKDRKTNSFHDKVKAIKDGSMWRVDIPALLWIHDGDILKIEPIKKGLK